MEKENNTIGRLFGLARLQTAYFRLLPRGIFGLRPPGRYRVEASFVYDPEQPDFHCGLEEYGVRASTLVLSVTSGPLAGFYLSFHCVPPEEDKERKGSFLDLYFFPSGDSISGRLVLEPAVEAMLWGAALLAKRAAPIQMSFTLTRPIRGSCATISEIEFSSPEPLPLRPN